MDLTGSGRWCVLGPVSGFGFGGTNFHVTVEEYAGSARPARMRAVPSELVLISGSSAASLAALRAAADRPALDGIAVTRLDTAAAFHGPLVAPAREPLLAYLNDLNDLDVRPLSGVVYAVAFVDTIETMYTAGVRTFVEVGPGTVLSGLVGGILGERTHSAVALDRPGHHGLTSLQNGLGRLAVQGVTMDLESQSAQAGEPSPTPAEPLSKSAVRLNGGNYGRPHPPEAAGGLPPVMVPAPRDVPTTRRDTPPAEEAARPDSSAPEPPAPDDALKADDAPEADDVAPDEAPAPDDGPAARRDTPTKRDTPPGAAPHVPGAAPHVPAVGPGMPPAVEEAWLRLIENAQRQLAEVQTAFQRTMAESHAAYMRMAEATMTSVLGAVTGQPPSHPMLAPAPAPAPAPPTAPAPGPNGLPNAAPPHMATARPGTALPPQAGPAEPMTPPPPAESMAAAPQAGPEPLPAHAPAARAEPVPAAAQALPTAPAAPPSVTPSVGVPERDSVQQLTLLPSPLDPAPEDVGAVLLSATDQAVQEAVQEKAPPQPAVTATLDPTPAFAAAPKAARAAIATRTEPQADLVRQVLRPVPAIRSGLSMPGLANGLIAVTDDGRGIAALVVKGLRGHGLDAKVVAEVPADAHSVVVLHGLRPVVSVDSAAEAQRAALRAARAVSRRMESTGGLFVTVQDTGGDFGLATPAEPPRAWLGGLRALAQTIAKEWPAATVKAIDCATDGRSAAAVADDIVAELVSGAGATQVGLRGDGTRVVPVLTDAPARNSRAQRLGTGSLVVVSGGARGVTAAALKPIVADRKPRLVILGRTPLSAEPPGLAAAETETELIRLLAERGPGSPADVAGQARRILAAREINETLTSLRREGVECRYVSVDVRDTEAVRDTLEFVRMDWGPVSAIIHGAGVLADARIADKTDEQFVRVFGTKVHGLDALLAATAEDPLEVLCVFSSVAAVFGNPGQSDYAMANEVLGQVLASEQARRPGCLVRAIAWGPWQGGMVTPAVAERFRDSGVELIDPAAGARAFAEEMAGPVAGDVVVVRAARGEYVTGVSTAGEVTVTGTAYPYLTDHRINDVPVLPVATVLDWFARIARAGQPDRAGLVLHDLRVLDKVTLPLLAKGGYRLALGARESAAEGVHTVELDLTDDTGRTHVRAAATAGTGATEHWAAPTGLEPLDDPYDTLFHGPALRVLRGAPTVGPGGAYGAVAGSAVMGWPHDGAEVDVAAVDGALQLALLWAKRSGAGDTLPMSVVEVRLHRRGPATGELRCVVHAVRADDAGAVCDIALLDADGAPRVELLGVHLVRRPGG